MATIVLNAPLDFRAVSVGNWLSLVPQNVSPTLFAGNYSFDPRFSAAFSGNGFTYAANGVPNGGTVTGYVESFDGTPLWSIGGASVPVTQLLAFAQNNNTVGALTTVLAGDDQISGSAGADVLFGFGGNDSIAAGAGNDAVYGNDGNDSLFGNAGQDILVGGAGNDLLVGGEGGDIAGFAVLRRQETLSGTYRGTLTLTGPEGTDQLQGVETLSFVDGRLVFDVADPFAVAYRMYDSAFNRLPDTLGLNSWAAQLSVGLTLAGLAVGFAGSGEFQQAYGGLSNQNYVQQLYRNVLDREADANGLAAWTAALDAGSQTRAQVLAGFSESPEHIELLRGQIEVGLWDQKESAASVARLYYAALDRAPDTAGLTGWTNAVDTGQTLANVADGFALSAEFATTYGQLSNEDYVRQLYQNVLDRTADATGLASWTGELNAGRLDRGDVLLGFSESAEFQVKVQPAIDGGIFFV